jgi:hypothetical protein
VTGYLVAPDCELMRRVRLAVCLGVIVKAQG